MGIFKIFQTSENINRWSIERHLNISLTFNLNMIIIQHVKGKFAEVNIYLSINSIVMIVRIALIPIIGIINYKHIPDRWTRIQDSIQASTINCHHYPMEVLIPDFPGVIFMIVSSLLWSVCLSLLMWWKYKYRQNLCGLSHIECIQSIDSSWFIRQSWSPPILCQVSTCKY